jgi:hypothetical protein
MVAGSTDAMFSVEGTLAGRRVGATWWKGSVTGDQFLVVAAQVVIAFGVTVQDQGCEIRASFNDLGGAAIALIHALDEVHEAKVTLPSRRHLPESQRG